MGKVITTAGISAGIDGALHLVSRLRGEETAKEVAEYMEYDKWVPNQGMVIGKANDGPLGHLRNNVDRGFRLYLTYVTYRYLP